jgi:hypothetical protein
MAAADMRSCAWVRPGQFSDRRHEAATDQDVRIIGREHLRCLLRHAQSYRGLLCEHIE